MATFANIPVVTRPLKLADYTPEFGDVTIQVWVNPPRKYLNRYDDIINAAQPALVKLKEDPGNLEAAEIIKNSNQQFAQWYTEIWSAGPAETRWTIEEVNTLTQNAAETDPALWGWLTSHTMQMIKDYKAGQKNS